MMLGELTCGELDEQDDHYEEYPEEETVFTLVDFILLVKCGALSDYDGVGKYIVDGKVTDEVVDIQKLLEAETHPAADKIEWYAK